MEQMEFVKGRMKGVTVAHLIAALVFSNWDLIQRQFRQTFFKTSPDESDHSLKQRHSNFCHLSRLLRELVEQHGVRKYFYTESTPSFYHGINTKTLHSAVIGTHCFLSFSATMQCIASLGDDNGLVLELGESEYFLCSPKYCDLSTFSDYPAENEQLLIPAEIPHSPLLEIKNVLDTKRGCDYRLYLRSLGVLKQMVNGWQKGKDGGDLKKDGEWKVVSKLVRLLLSHELSVHSDRFEPFNEIPDRIALLLHDFILSVRKVNVLWLDWSEAGNVGNALVNGEGTFLDIALMLKLFVNCREMVVVNDAECISSETLVLTTDILDSVFAVIQSAQEVEETVMMRLRKVAIVGAKEWSLSVSKAVGMYESFTENENFFDSID